MINNKNFTIAERPTNISSYYSSFHDKAAAGKQANLERIEKNKIRIAEYDELIQKNPIIKIGDDIFNPNDYDEFYHRKYSSGKYSRAINRLRDKNGFSNNEIFIYCAMIAQLLEDNAALERMNALYDKCLVITYDHYRLFLKLFVQKINDTLLKDGYGYAFGNSIGWICINRIHKNPKGKRKCLDFAATKKNKAKLLAEGKRLWNKDEAEFCKQAGIKYTGVDYRVYKDNDYFYEIPLIDCRIKFGHHITFEPKTYRGGDCRLYTNDELLKACNNDIDKICQLDLDLKTKLSLALQASPGLYLKYIRNENQTPASYWSSNWKDR